MVGRTKLKETIQHRFDVDDTVASLLTEVVFDNITEDNKECLETEEGLNLLLNVLEELLT